MKNDVPGDIRFFVGSIITNIALVATTIPKKYGKGGSKIEFMTIEGAEIRKAQAPKNLKEIVIWNFVEKDLEGRFVLKYGCG